MTKYLLGFDVGTQGSKAVLVDLKGNIIVQRQKDHAIIIEQLGFQEQDINLWWSEFKECIQEILESVKIKAEEIKAIGITGLVPGLCLIDQDGNPIRNAILHTDVRAEKELEYINREFQSNISFGRLLPNLLWVKNNEQENYRKIFRFLVPHSFIVYQLTGKTTIDYDTATIIGEVFDELNTSWIEEKIKKIGLDLSMFPTIYPADKVVGNIRSEVAEELGLSTETKVISGTGDSFASMIGGGAFAQKQLMIYLGTSTTIIYADGCPKEYIDKPHFAEGRANFVGKILSFGESVAHMKSIFRYKEWTELEEGLKNTAVGAEGIYYLPHYKLQSGNSFFGLDAEYILGYRSKHDQFNLYRALIEGIAYNIKFNLSQFHKEISQINILGGGANSKTICQIIADILDREVNLSKKKSTALGVAFLAGFGANEINDFGVLEDCWYTEDEKIVPISRNTEIYLGKYEIYQNIRRKIAELDDALLKGG